MGLFERSSGLLLRWRWAGCLAEEMVGGQLMGFLRTTLTGESAVGRASSEDSRLNGRPCLRRAISMALVFGMDDSGYSFLYERTPGAASSSFGRRGGDLDFRPGGSLDSVLGVPDFDHFRRFSSL